MFKTIHRTTSTLALILAAAGASYPVFAGSVNGSRPSVTLRIVNEAGVDRRTLSRAGKEAAAILERSGVQLILVSCETGSPDVKSVNPCQRERGPTEFWFRIFVQRPRTTSDEVLGFTELDECLGIRSAGVSYTAAVQLAKKYSADVFQIIGAAIAHEVGHLVLGAGAHTPQGLMSPHWGRIEFELISISELSFTSDQSKWLQKEIGARSAAVIRDRNAIAMRPEAGDQFWE